MPVHDWSRVGVGIFHDFHLTWNVEIKKELNGGVLPPDHYCDDRTDCRRCGPRALTLQAVAPIGAINDYALKRRSLVIRHTSDDRVVAIIEILSPGNKSSRHTVRSFVKKAAAYLAPVITLCCSTSSHQARATRKGFTGPSGKRSRTDACVPLSINP